MANGEPNMNAMDIERAMAHHIGIRTHVIVPNVSWAMFDYELDLCSLDIHSMYATEVEIKISKSDLKADLKKPHHHHNPWMHYLYFAMPESMQDCIDLVPEHAGIYLVKESNKWGEPEVLKAKQAVVNKEAKKWDDHKAFELARLASLRYWNTRGYLETAKKELASIKGEQKA